MELRITVKSNSFEKGLLPAEVETVDKTGAVDGPSKDLDREKLSIAPFRPFHLSQGVVGDTQGHVSDSDRYEKDKKNIKGTRRRKMQGLIAKETHETKHPSGQNFKVKRILVKCGRPIH